MGRFKNPMKMASGAKDQVRLAQGVSVALMQGLQGEDVDMDLGGGVRIRAYQVVQNVEQGGQRRQEPVLRIDMLGLVQLARDKLPEVGCDEG